MADYTKRNLEQDVEDMAPKCRLALDDEVVELGQWDAVRIPGCG